MSGEDKKVEEGMSELKQEFVKHMQRARGQGIAIGSKTIAFAVMSMASEAKEDSGIEKYKEVIDKIVSMCQRTTNLSLEDFIEQKELVETIMNTTADVKEEQAQEEPLEEPAEEQGE